MEHTVISAGAEEILDFEENLSCDYENLQSKTLDVRESVEYAVENRESDCLTIRSLNDTNFCQEVESVKHKEDLTQPVLLQPHFQELCEANSSNDRTGSVPSEISINCGIAKDNCDVISCEKSLFLQQPLKEDVSTNLDKIYQQKTAECVSASESFPNSDDSCQNNDINTSTMQEDGSNIQKEISLESIARPNNLDLGIEAKESTRKISLIGKIQFQFE